MLGNFCCEQPDALSFRINFCRKRRGAFKISLTEYLSVAVMWLYFNTSAGGSADWPFWRMKFTGDFHGRNFITTFKIYDVINAANHVMHVASEVKIARTWKRLKVKENYLQISRKEAIGP